MGVLGGLNAVWCGVGGFVGGWARVTKSSPNESDSLSDSGIWWSLDGARIGCANFNSFAGKQVSSNFISWEISKHWCIPELVSLGTRFVTNEDYSSALWL